MGRSRRLQGLVALVGLALLLGTTLAAAAQPRGQGHRLRQRPSKGGGGGGSSSGGPPWLDSNDECKPWEVPEEQRCGYVREHASQCTEEKKTIVSYVDLYYCYLQGRCASGGGGLGVGDAMEGRGLVWGPKGDD